MGVTRAPNSHKVPKIGAQMLGKVGMKTLSSNSEFMEEVKRVAFEKIHSRTLAKWADPKVREAAKKETLKRWEKEVKKALLCEAKGLPIPERSRERLIARRLATAARLKVEAAELLREAAAMEYNAKILSQGGNILTGAPTAEMVYHSIPEELVDPPGITGLGEEG